MAVFFNDPKRNGDFLADWADRAGDEVIGALLEYERSARALRYQMFDPNVVNDSGWLLAQDLFAAYLKGEKMRTRKLCAASGLPQTTVLRYLDEHGNVPGARLDAVAYGHERPLIDPSKPGAMAMNKRVDIVVLSSASEDARKLFREVMSNRPQGRHTR